jgi:multidrug efflux pump
MNKEKAFKRMTELPINKLLLHTGIPMVISLVLQAFYNIVDSAFVSRMAENGEAALNALTLAFPIQMLLIAIAIGTGVGTNALISRSLGLGEGQKAAKAAGNSLFLAAVVTIAAVLFGLFGVESYIGSQTKNPLIFQMAVLYLRICCIASVGNIFFAIFEKLLQSTGLSLFSSIAQVAGALTNIILDPIMIYGLMGCPALGVAGAAYATVIGQIVSCLTALFFHFKFNRSIEIKRNSLLPSGQTIGEIYKIGLPAIISQALMSFMTYGLNLILVGISEGMVTAYGLYYKIQQFLLFAAFGMRDALTPIVAFNYGHGSKQRVKDCLKYGILYTSIIMIAGLLLLELFANPFASLFGLSGATEALYVSAIRIISISLLFAGVSISLQGAFQGLNAGTETLILSALRQFVFVLPIAFCFSLLAKYHPAYTWAVWITFPLSEGLSSLFAVRFIKRLSRSKIETMEPFSTALDK